MPPYSQANPNSSVLTVSPPDSNFTPRREFVRDHHAPSDFALLAIASASLVRLSAFPQDLVTILHHTFQQRQGIRAIREDKSLDLIEFSLEQKPWSTSKSVESEKLFLDVLTIIFQHGYNFVSTIDYGREHDDRLSIAFSKPKSFKIIPAGESRSASPTPHHFLVKVPFALSFPSSTTLRVINPPLNSTPAILQGVRAAWPRGVISEKKLTDGCFEFKLKGYGWFQEDTFAADSLQHILALLNSLDNHAFTLITSLSLSGNRSRVKDLWIFTGPPHERSESSNDSNIDLSRSLPMKGLHASGEFGRLDTQHARSSSMPTHAPSAYPLNMHARAATEPNALQAAAQPSLTPQNSHSVLRKRSSPKALGIGPTFSSNGSSSPLKQSFDDELRPAPRRFIVGDDGHVDMTGIGSAAQRHQTLKANDGSRQVTTMDTRETLVGGDRQREDFMSQQSQQRVTAAERVKTGELFYTTAPHLPPLDEKQYPREKQFQKAPDFFHSDSSPEVSRSASGSDSSRQLTPKDDNSPPPDVPRSVYGQVFAEAMSEPSPPILSPGAFRDSAFSSNTDRSYDIPIAWTGPKSEKKRDRYSTPNDESSHSISFTDEGNYHYDSGKRTRPLSRQQSPLNFPGAWQPTPIEEKPEDQAALSSPQEDTHEAVDYNYMPQRKEVDAERMASPTKSDQLAASRKSETALYGMLPEPSNATQAQQSSPGPSPEATQPIGSGWVLVNVDSRQRGDASDRPTSSSSATASHRLSNQSQRSSEPQMASSMSPVAKVIAAADAVAQPEEPQQPSGFKRLFAGGKSKSNKKLVVQEGVAKVKTFEVEENEKSRKRSIGQKWRQRGSRSRSESEN